MDPKYRIYTPCSHDIVFGVAANAANRCDVSKQRISMIPGELVVNEHLVLIVACNKESGISRKARTKSRSCLIFPRYQCQRFCIVAEAIEHQNQIGQCIYQYMGPIRAELEGRPGHLHDSLKLRPR